MDSLTREHWGLRKPDVHTLARGEPFVNISQLWPGWNLGRGLPCFLISRRS